MRTKNNQWIEDVNKQLDELLGGTLQNVGGANPPTPERKIN